MTGLEKFILPDFNGGAVAIRFRKDQTLFAQGAPGDSVFYIQEGSVEIAVLSEQGKEAVVAILAAGDFCGEGCLAGQAVRMASVVAMTDGVATRIAKSTVVRMLHDNPEFSELFTGIFSRVTSASKPTLSISFSIRAKSVLRACFCCLRTSAKTKNRKRSFLRSARRCWPR